MDKKQHYHTWGTFSDANQCGEALCGKTFKNESNSSAKRKGLDARRLFGWESDLFHVTISKKSLAFIKND